MGSCERAEPDSVRDAPKRAVRGRIAKLSTLQQRFEESRVGQLVISGLVVAIVAIGVASNLPDSAIKRALFPVLRPVATATYLDQGWAVYAPNPRTRIDTVEVHVTMADGGERVWTVQPGDRLIGAFAWIHWEALTGKVSADPEVRMLLSRWVVGEVTEPSERPVRVQMILRTEILPPPGQDTRETTDVPRATPVKILYQEDLTGR